MKKKEGSSLWSPNEEIKNNSHLSNFCKKLHEKRILKYTKNFQKIWNWSVKNPEIFWSELWDYSKIKGLIKYSIKMFFSLILNSIMLKIF